MNEVVRLFLANLSGMFFAISAWIIFVIIVHNQYFMWFSNFVFESIMNGATIVCAIIYFIIGMCLNYVAFPTTVQSLCGGTK